MHRVDRDDRPGQVGERLQQVPDGGDLVGLRIHGDLAEDRADAVRQGRDQVRGLPVLVLRAADGLAVDAITSRPPACAALVCSQAPRTRSSTSGLTRANARRNVDSSAGPRAAPSPASTSGAGVGGPLPDRGERPRPRDHRRDPDGEQPGQRMPAAAPLARVRDLGEEIEQVLAAGSAAWAKMSSAGGCPSWQTMVSVRTSIVPPGPRPPPADTPDTSPVVTTSQVTASLHDFAVSLLTRGIRRSRSRVTKPRPARRDNVINHSESLTHYGQVGKGSLCLVRNRGWGYTLRPARRANLSSSGIERRRE